MLDSQVNQNKVYSLISFIQQLAYNPRNVQDAAFSSFPTIPENIEYTIEYNRYTSQVIL